MAEDKKLEGDVCALLEWMIATNRVSKYSSTHGGEEAVVLRADLTLILFPFTSGTAPFFRVVGTDDTTDPSRWLDPIISIPTLSPVSLRIDQRLADTVVRVRPLLAREINHPVRVERHRCFEVGQRERER